MFSEEVNALIMLSKSDITPNVYGVYIDLSKDHMYYILDRLDCTLGDMFRNNTFKSYHVELFMNLVENLIKTQYRHDDLHIDNVMFSNKMNKFYLIDFGKIKTLNKKNKDGNYFTILSDSEDVQLIDSKKTDKNAILGTSGFSALSTIFLFLTKSKNAESDKALNKLKAFIKKNVPKHKYKSVIFMLEHTVLET